MNKYKRNFRIKYWCVSLVDIKIVYDFISRRIGERDINLEAEFVSGNNIYTKDIEKLLEIIRIRINEKDDLNKVRVSFYSQESNISKILIMILESGSDYSSFILEASDIDDELKDWVAGTREEFEKINKQFEIEEKYRDYFNKKYVKGGFGYPIIFDPFGKIKKEIIGQDKIKKNEKIQIAINGDNNSGLINSHNKIIHNNEDWYKKWWGQLILMILGGLILSFLIYKIGWNR